MRPPSVAANIEALHAKIMKCKEYDCVLLKDGREGTIGAYIRTACILSMSIIRRSSCTRLRILRNFRDADIEKNTYVFA